MSFFVSLPAWRSISRTLWQKQWSTQQRKRICPTRKCIPKWNISWPTALPPPLQRRKSIIGSHHFVFEDEKCVIPEGMEQRFEELPEEYSHLYLAIEGSLAAVICIEDPLREEAHDVIKNLKKAGFTKIVMMTGDSERTAQAIAATSRRGRVLFRSAAGRQGKLCGDREKQKAGRSSWSATASTILQLFPRQMWELPSAMAQRSPVRLPISPIGADDLEEVVTLEDQRRPDETDSRKLSLHRRPSTQASSPWAWPARSTPRTTPALLHNTSVSWPSA